MSPSRDRGRLAAVAVRFGSLHGAPLFPMPACGSFAADVDDVAVVQQPVDACGGHHLVAEHRARMVPRSRPPELRRVDPAALCDIWREWPGMAETVAAARRAA